MSHPERHEGRHVRLRRSVADDTTIAPGQRIGRWTYRPRELRHAVGREADVRAKPRRRGGSWWPWRTPS